MPLKVDHGLQTGDLLLVLGVRVGHDGVLPLGDLLGNRHILRDGRVALLERALEVDVADLLAQVGFLVDESDEAVFDLHEHFGAVFDFLAGGPVGDYGEGRATRQKRSVVSIFVKGRGAMKVKSDLRGRWVRVEVYVVDRENVL